MSKVDYLKGLKAGFNFAMGFMGANKLQMALAAPGVSNLASAYPINKFGKKKNNNPIPGGKRAQRDHETYRLIWPYIAHAFYIYPHCFEKGASLRTQHQYVMQAQSQKTPKDGFKTFKIAFFTPKDMRRCMEYYAKKGALTRVGNQYFRKGW